MTPRHLLPACLLACDPVGPRVLSGDHIDIVLDPGVEPCGDLVAHMDRFIALVADRWHVDLADQRYSFHWYAPNSFLVDAGCPAGTAGCAHPTLASAASAPLDHELVHLVSFAVGRPPPFFIEGAAVAFELTNTLVPGDVLPGTAYIQGLLTADPLPADAYPLAGAYTRFLIDRHGLPAYLDFYASMDRSADPSEVAAVHADLFAEPIAATIAAFDAERRACDFARFNFKLFECSGDPLAWDEHSLVVRRDLACDADDVVGPFYYGRESRLYAAFDLTTPGAFTLSLASDPGGAALTLGACGGCDSAAPVTVRAGAGPQRIDLAAGRHYLLLTGSAAQDVTAALHLERVPD